jgi:hypothetical protein
MKNSAFSLFVPALIAILILSACTFGLVPASSRDSAATVSLKLGSLDATGNLPSRAIVQGGGYLYIRTVGGPTGDSGPFYGPYPVSSGENFSTTDLPAGTYTFMALYYSANKLDETKTLSFNGGTYTFRQIMQMSDDVLMSKDTSISGTTFADLFGGEVSTGRTHEATLAAGSTTALSATLIPVCGENNSIFAGNSGYALPSTSTTVKTFYVISGISTAKGSTISCTMTPGASGTATIGTVMFYGFDGTPLSTPKSVGTITAATTVTATVTGTDTTIDTTTANSYSAAYLYIEYQATDLTLYFGGSSSTVASSLACTLTSNNDWPNKTMYIKVYDASVATTTVAPTVPGYLGVGVLTTDSAGNGSCVIYDYVTGKAMAPLEGHTYGYKAFFDNKSRYANFMSAEAVISALLLDSIVPNYRDYTSSSEAGFVAKSGDTLLGLNIEGFTSLDKATIYVASTPSGTGMGLDTLDVSAFDNLSNLLTQFSDASGIDIVLMGDVDLSTTLNLTGGAVSLTSYNQAGRKISYKDPGACLYVTANTFTMSSVVLDGTGVTFPTLGALSIGGSTQATLGPGTVIQNMTSSATPAGAALDISGGGTVIMEGSSIKNCTATSGNGGGGGVYNSGSFIMKAGSSITGCTTACNGGGVYMISGSSMTMESGSVISGCTATDATSKGGGIYADSGVTKLEFMTGASVTGNSVPSTGTGGGVYDVSGIATGYDSAVTGNFVIGYPSMGSNYFKN